LQNGFLADKKITYLVDLRATSSPILPATNVRIEEYSETVVNSELEKLALQAGILSRFNVDPKCSSEDFERLYKIWIKKAVAKEVADAVLVSKENGKIIGMVTVGEKNRRGNIGLFSVNETMRGKNVGVSLVLAAHKWAVNRGFNLVQVVTQGDNAAACRLYEKCGYYVEKTEYYYHFWM
jgi:dTDP-4-amino-4,6-dideoxy-D-galactose acyltransferase